MLLTCIIAIIHSAARLTPQFVYAILKFYMEVSAWLLSHGTCIHGGPLRADAPAGFA